MLGKAGKIDENSDIHTIQNDTQVAVFRVL